MKKIFLLLTFSFIVFYCIGAGKNYGNREHKKLNKYSSIIKLTNKQQNSILSSASKKYKDEDSLSSNLTIEERIQLQYVIDREFHEALVNELTEKQLMEYIQVYYAPEIKSKTEYYMSLLKEVNASSSLDFNKTYKEIYNYLMLEKSVYFKYKYDFALQKSNISRIKKIQPKSLKASLNIEKQKSLGRVSNGIINWE